jgi:hypothetical protein
VLSLVYLLLLDALAGAIPVIFELAGCLITLGLKLAYDHTRWGKQQQEQQAAALQEQLLTEAAHVIEQQLHTVLQDGKQLSGDCLVRGGSSCRSSFDRPRHPVTPVPPDMTVNIREHPLDSSSCSSGAGSGADHDNSTSANAAAGGSAACSQLGFQMTCSLPSTVVPLPHVINSNSNNNNNNNNNNSNYPADNLCKKPAALQVPSTIPSANGSTASGSNPGASISSTPTGALALQLLQLLQHQQQHLPWYMRTGIRHTASISTGSYCSSDGCRTRCSLGDGAAGVATTREHSHSLTGQHQLPAGPTVQDVQGPQRITVCNTPGAAALTALPVSNHQRSANGIDAAASSAAQRSSSNSISTSRLAASGRVSLLNPGNFFACSPVASPRSAAAACSSICETSQQEESSSDKV